MTWGGDYNQQSIAALGWLYALVLFVPVLNGSCGLLSSALF